MNKILAMVVVLAITLTAIGWVNLTCISALANDEVVICE